MSFQFDNHVEVTRLFREYLKKGLESDGHVLKMINSHISKLPRRTESGVFYSCDLGGTNFRIARVELLPNAEDPAQVLRWKYPIPDEYKQHGIFDFMAKCWIEYWEKEFFLGKESGAREIPVGFTFSYPTNQKSLRNGQILRFAKDILCEDLIGRDPSQLLEEAVERLSSKNTPKLRVVALLNDSVASLLSASYKFDSVLVAVILGTGTNAAYIEKREKILKVNEESSDPIRVINIEWGAFGEDESLGLLPINKYDQIVDGKSLNSGKQRFEKLISGKYLGELVKLAAEERLGVEIGSIDGWMLTDLEKGNELEVLNLFNQDQISIIREISAKVVSRSAQLCACAISAVILHCVDFSEEITVAVEGSLYEFYPNYPNMLKIEISKILKKLEVQKKINLRLNKGGSVAGGAVAVSMQK